MPDPSTSSAYDRATKPESAGAPCVLLVGFDQSDFEALRDQIAGDYDLLEAPNGTAARLLLESRRIDVVCLGERCPGEMARSLVSDAKEGTGGSALYLVLAAGPDPTLFRELIAASMIFFLTRRPPVPAECAALLRNAVLFRSQRERQAPPRDGSRLDISEVLRHVALLSEPADKAELLAELARDSVNADRAYCLLYDPVGDVLWTRDLATGEDRREEASVGLASFVLRSGLTVSLGRVAEDPRYDQEADDPSGGGAERILAVPVRPADGPVAAVLVAVRSAEAAEFSHKEVWSLEWLAAAMAPHLLSPERSMADGSSSEDMALFRQEALEHRRPPDDEQDPLRISPAWTRWSTWILLAALVTALVFSLVGEVHEYASGLAVVSMASRPPTLLVLIPGEYRPLIRRGMPIRFKIPGFRSAYQTLAVDELGDEVLGPEEAGHYLAREVADTLSVSGPVAVLKARLPEATFEADGQIYRFHHGMRGTAEILVRSEKILFALIPGLKAIRGGNV
jgi:hypothetical protein